MQADDICDTHSAERRAQSAEQVGRGLWQQQLSHRQRISLLTSQVSRS